MQNFVNFNLSGKHDFFLSVNENRVPEYNMKKFKFKVSKVFNLLKFIYSEKATNFAKSSPYFCPM